MNPVLKKLQFKGGRLVVLGAREEYGLDDLIAGWAGEPEVTKVSNRLGKHETFVLCFVRRFAVGFEGVRQVAIDDQWSALRFRRAEFIETMNRSWAMSAEGKRRMAAGRSADSR
jgi:hypothetical protein